MTYNYIEGIGQRYVGVADVAIWLAKRATEAMEAYVAEINGQNNTFVVDILKARYQMANEIALNFVAEHNIGTREIVRSEDV